MGLFDGIENARIGKGGFYFLDEAGRVLTARYIVDVSRVYSQTDRNQRGMYIIEATIVWSDNPERTVGMIPSQVIMTSWDGWLGKVKAFLAACNGADPTNEDEVKAVFTGASGEDLTELMADYSVDKDNPLAGTRLELNCAMKPKKTKPQEMFTHHNWKPYDQAAFEASLAPAG